MAVCPNSHVQGWSGLATLRHIKNPNNSEYSPHNRDKILASLRRKCCGSLQKFGRAWRKVPKVYFGVAEVAGQKFVIVCVVWLSNRAIMGGGGHRHRLYTTLAGCNVGRSVEAGNRGGGAPVPGSRARVIMGTAAALCRRRVWCSEGGMGLLGHTPHPGPPSHYL